MNKVNKSIGFVTAVDPKKHTQQDKADRQAKLADLFDKTSVKNPGAIGPTKPLPESFDKAQHLKLIDQRRASREKVRPTSAAAYARLRDKFK